jgi:hypothetical protein
LSEDNTSTLKVAAIIIMGEADLCGSILESHPFSREARKPRETDLHQLTYERTVEGWLDWRRRHLGQYITSALSLQKAKSRMLLVSSPESVRPVSLPLAPASKRLKTESVTEESEINMAEVDAA